MRLGTKILLMMLLITIGSSAAVSWLVTLAVTRYETDRVNDQISLAIARYLRDLDRRSSEINGVVQTTMEDPQLKSFLGNIDLGDATARSQLKEEIFPHTVGGELKSLGVNAAFHVLFNAARERLLVSVPDAPSASSAPADPPLEKLLSSDMFHWPIDDVIDSQSRTVICYLSTAGRLFLAMGLPLHKEVNELPSHAYFVGFQINDDWIKNQLLAQEAAPSFSSVPICAWFVAGDQVVARGSTDPSDMSYLQFAAGKISPAVPRQNNNSPGRPIVFDIVGERFVGQSFGLDPHDPAVGQLILASSLNRALAPLHRLQQTILIAAAAACALAILVCRVIASAISRPIQELVQGTRRIAAGEFDSPVQIRRHDELGLLADSFNQMSQGLKERDALRETRFKMERDLDLARQIQMGVLPKILPLCPGYELAATSIPAEQTGGDVYDIIPLSSDSNSPDHPPPLAILLADATGHGIAAALSVTQVRSMLRIGLRLDAHLDSVLTQINSQLFHDLSSNRFVTAFLGLLDPIRHRLQYHSAGQGPLLHFHAADRTLQWLDTSMPPLGISEEVMSDGSICARLEPGDLLVLLTDGFYECQNPAGQLFGQHHVAQIVDDYRGKPAQQILDALIHAANQFVAGGPQTDDMTGIIIRRLP